MFGYQYCCYKQGILKHSLKQAGNCGGHIFLKSCPNLHVDRKNLKIILRDLHVYNSRTYLLMFEI